MRVAELREALRSFPDDMLVVTRGFDECGFEEVAPPKRKRIWFAPEEMHTAHVNYNEDVEDCSDEPEKVSAAVECCFID